MAKRKSTEPTIKLTDSVGIEQASSVKKQLTEAIKSKKTVSLDISEVTDIDTSIIQLILSAKKDADAKEKEFYISGTIPEDIQKLLNLLSLSLPLKQEVANV